ncbi:hypothetical protein PILCRDRAFT_812019 [Piloderma croceum F 1598]|uniref:Uncharacterized protein n=1 Tax=Piloderma croceum (strain F 1598) TaxID=765440 RepID=A0A0C3GF29_PILCF|nr:hypothetical protein PILCRDRAFT_812019 [Piloderma croceum F 1598]
MVSNDKSDSRLYQACMQKFVQSCFREDLCMRRYHLTPRRHKGKSENDNDFHMWMLLRHGSLALLYHFNHLILQFHYLSGGCYGCLTGPTPLRVTAPSLFTYIALTLKHLNRLKIAEIMRLTCYVLEFEAQLVAF